MKDSGTRKSADDKSPISPSSSSLANSHATEPSNNYEHKRIEAAKGGLYARLYRNSTESPPASQRLSSLGSASIDIAPHAESAKDVDAKSHGFVDDIPGEVTGSDRKSSTASRKAHLVNHVAETISAGKHRASKKVRVVSASLMNAKSTTPLNAGVRFPWPWSTALSPPSMTGTKSVATNQVEAGRQTSTAPSSDLSEAASVVSSNDKASEEMKARERIRHFSQNTIEKLRVKRDSVGVRAKRSYNSLKNGIPVVLLTLYSIASAWALLAVERNSKLSLYPGQTNATCVGTDFWKALFYVNTLYTTIGYGNVYACTMWSRILSVVIAIVGIPFVFIVLNSAGRLLGTVMNKICIISSATWKFVDRKRRGKPTPGLWDRMRASLDEDEPIHVPIYLGIVLTILWVMVCATYFSITERWDYMSSLYFSLISLMTIGLGDLAPGQYALGVITFCAILVGLSLVSMSIKVVQAHIEHLFNEMKIDIMTDDSIVKPKTSDSQDASGGRAVTARAQGRYLHALLSEKQLQTLDKMVEKKTRLRIRGIQAVAAMSERGTNPVMAEYFRDNKAVNTVSSTVSEKRCQTEPIEALPPLVLLPRTSKSKETSPSAGATRQDGTTAAVPVVNGHAPSPTKTETPHGGRTSHGKFDNMLGQGLNLVKRTVSVSFNNLAKSDTVETAERPQKTQEPGHEFQPPKVAGHERKEQILNKVKKTIKDSHDAMKKDPHLAQGAEFVANVRKSVVEKAKQQSARKISRPESAIAALSSSQQVQRSRSNGTIKTPPDISVSNID